MKFDRTTVLGIVLLALLFVGLFYFNNKQAQESRKQAAIEQARKDSLQRLNRPKEDTLTLKKNTARPEPGGQVAATGGLKDALKGTEQVVTVKNSLFTIAFTNKGGQPKWIELNNFKGMDSAHVRLAASSFDKISYRVNTGNNGSDETANFYFQPAVITTNPDSSTTVSFTLASTDSAFSSAITHRYIIRPNDYMIDFDVHMKGADKLLSGGIMNLSWQYAAAQQEPSLSYEETNTQVGYVEDGEFDYHTIGRRSSKEFSSAVKWVGIRQRFFNGFLIAKDRFSDGKMEWVIPGGDKKVVVQATTNLRVPVAVASEATVGFNLFYGPADYHTLRKYDLKLDKLINLGQGMYAFVRPLNKYVILPVWDFINGFVGNYGIVIALLTLFIRLLISPLTYKSYLSGAKMKALRPEIAALNQKFGDDQQAKSMEQMKLFKEAGVNPLGGCIPALLQIPIFFALFSFFNAEPGLRGADFLWSSDLSAYDAPIHFGFNIPLLGSHLSLFNITAVVTSFLISLYSMSLTPDQSNPVMKYMPYFFPVLLLFFFNNLPSALTWYYTVSNVVTLILQFVIQNYIIDHDKILAQIEANRKKPRTKSKWQERLEQMQEQQKKMKEIQQKGKKR